MKTSRKITALFLALMVIISLLPTTAFAAAHTSVPAYTMAAGGEELEIYVDVSIDSRIIIKDTNGNRFVYQSFKIIENNLNLSAEELVIEEPLPPLSTKSYSDSKFIVIFGKLDSYTITSENEDLHFSIRYQVNEFSVYAYAGDSLGVIAENDAISAYSITSVKTKPTYSISIENDCWSILLSVTASDRFLIFTPMKGDSFTIKGAESYSLNTHGLISTDTVMPDGTLLVRVADSGNKSKLPFVDVSTDDWFYEAVREMYYDGIMKGTDEIIFSPYNFVTRGMFVTMLYNIHAMSYYPPRHSFDDVSSEKYYDEAVSWAVEYGIVIGYSATKFGPDDNITREQLVTMINRYINAFYKHETLRDTGFIASSFADFNSVSGYAREPMEEAVKYGFVNGRTVNTLDPQGMATRAEAAVMVARMCYAIFEAQHTS